VLTGEDHARQVLEINLMHYAGVRRDNLEIGESLLAPAQKRVPLAVTLEFYLGVQVKRVARAEVIHHDRMIDDQLRRREWIDFGGIAA
jgi:hypothetical protein